MVPNVKWPGLKDGTVPGWPATDEEARAAGLVKLERISGGGVLYRLSVDARALVAGGEYEYRPY